MFQKFEFPPSFPRLKGHGHGHGVATIVKINKNNLKEKDEKGKVVLDSAVASARPNPCSPRASRVRLIQHDSEPGHGYDYLHVGTPTKYLAEEAHKRLP